MTISAGALIGSSLIAGGTALANKWIEKRRYERQLADQHKLWQENNAYNSPSAQMARLKAAGLNPNLVYQNGGASVGSDQISPPDFQTTPISEFNDIMPNIMTASSIEADVNQKNAQTAEILSDTKVKNSPIGKVAQLDALSQTEKNFYATRLGIPVSQLDSLSMRGSMYLAELHNRVFTAEQNENLKYKSAYDVQSAENMAISARMAAFIDMMNVDTEAKKHGYRLGVETVPFSDGSQSYITSLSKDPKARDLVYEYYLRTLKEVRWISSDAKHIFDTANQTIGNVGNLIPKYHKGMFADKYKKNKF